MNFESQIREIQELKRTGQITNAEFEEMRDRLEAINRVSMSNIKQELQKIERDRAFQALQRESGMDTQIMQGRARAANAIGNVNGARAFDAAAKASEIGSAFRDQVKELQDLKRAGELTSSEFDRMMGKLRELNSMDLQNLRQEIKNTASEGIVDQLAQGNDAKSPEAIRRSFGRIRDRFREMSQEGYFSEEQRSQFQSAMSRVQALTTTGASDRTLRREFSQNRDNPFFAQFLEQAGRSDIAALANMPTQASMNAALGQVPGQTSLQGTGIEGTLTNLGDRVSGQLDRIIAVLGTALNAPRSLTVQTKDPVSDASKLYKDFAKDEARAIGL